MGGQWVSDSSTILLSTQKILTPFKIMSSIGKNTFYGLCVIIPLAIVGIVLVKLAEILEKIAKPLGLDSYFGATLVIILAVLAILLLCFLIGVAVHRALSFETFEEKLLKQIPGYEIIATVVRGFTSSRDTSAFPAALINLHGHGVSAIGFIMEEHDNEQFTVFIPSTPVLTVGNVYIVNRAQLTILDVKSQDIADTLSKWGMGSAKLLAQSAEKANRP